MDTTFRNTKMKLLAAFGGNLGRSRPLGALNINELRSLVEMHERRAEEMASFMAYLANPKASAFAHLPPDAFASLKPRGAKLNAELRATSSEATPTKVQATSAKILRAAEAARTGGPERPKPTGMAAKIIEMGKRRRGEK